MIASTLGKGSNSLFEEVLYCCCLITNNNEHCINRESDHLILPIHGAASLGHPLPPFSYSDPWRCYPGAVMGPPLAHPQIHELGDPHLASSSD